MTGTCFSLDASTVFSARQLHRLAAADQLAAADVQHFDDVAADRALVDLQLLVDVRHGPSSFWDYADWIAARRGERPAARQSAADALEVAVDLVDAVAVDARRARPVAQAMSTSRMRPQAVQ